MDWRSLGMVLLCATSVSFGAKAEQSEPTSSVEENSEAIDFESRDLSEYGAGKIPSGLIQLQPGSSYFPPYVFIVDKAERVLSIWGTQDGDLQRLAVYPADIGKNRGDKQFLGDKKTPEGIYFFLEKYERAALDYNTYGSRALTTDYPNYFDRRSKKTGSGIWLHAVPDSVPLTRGSRGCVVVRDDVVQTLHPYFKPGLTPIVIQDSVTFRSDQEQAQLQREFEQFLDQWQLAWQNKDLESYMQFYHRDFRAQRMDFEGWERHKANLNKQYETISVNLSKPVIYEHQDQYVIRLFQHYQSDQYEDFGEKTLYVLREDGELKIYGEDWRHQPRLLALEEIQRHSIASVNCGQEGEKCAPQKEPAL